MEENIGAQDVDKVLLICSKKYTEKANERKGGVGTETQIITPELYGKAEQTKFIPIVKDKDDEGNAYLPTFLKHTNHIDMSGDGYYNRYEQLIRCILEKPECIKPPLGELPVFDSISYNSGKTRIHFRKLKSLIEKESRRVGGEIDKFFELFCEEVEVFNSDKETDLNKTTQSINNYCELLKLSLDAGVFNPKPFHSFLEKLYSISRDDGNTVSQFIAGKIFIITVAYLMKKMRFQDICEILFKSYYITSPNRVNNYYEFFIFCNCSGKQPEWLNADLPKWITNNDLIETDIILALIQDRWYPRGLVKEQFNITYIDLSYFLQRCKSKSYAEEFMVLFGCRKIEKLREMIVQRYSVIEQRGSTRFHLDWILKEIATVP
jgi:hypothetical protein